jgi:DNA-binding transcriptional LysR family regulator
MLDGVSLDQLRTFVAAADEGSFSAAARKLGRVQSAVSGWIAALEDRVGVTLFDRSGRFPALTPAGTVLLADARSILSAVDTLKGRARLMASGVEAELSVVVDVFFPTAVISMAAKVFADRFPMTPLRLFVEGLGAAYAPVLDGRCAFGILAMLPSLAFPSLASERIGDVRLVRVVASGHPLARFGRRRVPRRELAKYVQLVLTDRSDLLAGRDYGVVSPSTWRLADLSTKHAFLKDGLGWGGMPSHMVDDDLAAGRLVLLDVDDLPRTGLPMPMSAYYRASEPPGPAGRWLIDFLTTSCPAHARASAAPSPANPAARTGRTATKKGGRSRP